LSRLPNIIEPTGAFDQTTNASLFYAKPKWLNDVKEFLKIGEIEGTLSIQQKQRLVRRAKPFTLQNGNCTKWAETIDVMMFDNNRSINGDERTT
jgi:hypothetical protein